MEAVLRLWRAPLAGAGFAEFRGFPTCPANDLGCCCAAGLRRSPGLMPEKEEFVARRGQPQTRARRTAPRNVVAAATRDDVMSVLARAVREVEDRIAARPGHARDAHEVPGRRAAAARRARPGPGERRHHRAPRRGRAAQAPRRHRDDPREDRRPRCRRSWPCWTRTPSSPTRPRRSSGTCCGPRASSRPSRRRGRRRRPRPPPPSPGRAAVGRLAAAGQPVPRPRLLGRPAERAPRRPGWPAGS